MTPTTERARDGCHRRPGAVVTCDVIVPSQCPLLWCCMQGHLKAGSLLGLGTPGVDPGTPCLLIYTCIK